MKTVGRFERARKCLLFWCWFIGVGAVGGATCMLLKPDGSLMGMQELLPFFQVLPFADVLFQNFVFPGVSLLIVNGLSNLTAAILLHRRKKSGVVLGGVFGVTLMLWICIQFVIFPANFLSTAYFFFGLCQAATGFAAWVFLRQETFAVDPGEYPNVGTNAKELVVYFSRMGYARRLAYEAANQSGAEIEELRATERTAGTLGFWWCGRFGMHRWDMPIEPLKADVAAYDKVTLVGSIWVFHLDGPMRAFCKAAKGKIKRVGYVINHFQPVGLYASAAEEMDALLGVKRESAESVCTQWGKVQWRRPIAAKENA